jgi:hypothetical protein
MTVSKLCALMIPRTSQVRAPYGPAGTALKAKTWSRERGLGDGGPQLDRLAEQLPR